MSDHEKKLNKDDLSQVKSLIGDASGKDFNLDDILAEFGAKPSSPRSVPTEPPLQGPDLPWPEAPKRPRTEGKVVAFPGTPRPQPEQEDTDAPEEEADCFDEPVVSDVEPTSEEQPEEDGSEDAPTPDEDLDESDEEEEAPTAQVIPFPEEESALSAFLKKMGNKADQYADSMFEEDEATDHEEVRRLERLIPGTDREEVEEEPEPPRWHRPKKVEPPPPDTAPQKLAQRYAKGRTGLRVRCLLVFLLTLVAFAQVLVPALGFTWLAPLDDPAVQEWIAAGLLGAGMLLGLDFILIGLIRAFQGKLGMDTLSALACVFTMADAIVLALDPPEEFRLPYGLVCLAGLYFQLHGTYHKRLGLRISCRTAAAASHPYRVTVDEGKWSGRDTFAKWQGTAEGFGSQIQSDDGAQRIFRTVCPVLLIGDVVLALLASLGTGNPQRLLWSLSALFTVSAAFGGSIAYGRSFHKIARRLSQSGAALAGWPGIVRAKKGDRVLITDTDLFPQGHVELNGYKVMRDFPAERVLAYTATLILDSGSGLGRLFHDQLRSMGGLLRKAERLTCYEGGGLSANIRGDQVLVGSAAFMNLMDISLPQGLNVKNAVFCAIDGQLAGIFALNYTLHDTVFPAMEELMGEKIGPVLATRDFNLIPAMLQQRFKLAADKMDFPPVERRRELSDPDQPHCEVLTALLCREGLLPFAEAVAASKRMYRAARFGGAVCCVGSVLGMALATYLTSIGAYTSLSVLNLMVYMLTWLAPVWLLSGWAHRY